MKILIVDDEKSIRFALKDIIEFEGHEVSLAADGKEGLEMALANSYDVIFSDIKMPVMDGLEATRRIKAAHPELPIIALTANAFDSDRQQAFEAGVDEFLSKPISSELCHATIARFI